MTSSDRKMFPGCPASGFGTRLEMDSADAIVQSAIAAKYPTTQNCLILNVVPGVTAELAF
jgi:hypothetical protein